MHGAFLALQYVPWPVREQGTSLSNNQLFNVVDCAITKKQVPYATNALYLVLGASNIVATSGMIHLLSHAHAQCSCT